MQISVWRLVSIYLGYLSRSRIADSCNNYNIYIFRNCRLVSKVCSHFTISTAIMSFHFSTFSPTFTVVCLDYATRFAKNQQPEVRNRSSVTDLILLGLTDNIEIQAVIFFISHICAECLWKSDYHHSYTAGFPSEDAHVFFPQEFLLLRNLIYFCL